MRYDAFHMSWNLKLSYEFDVQTHPWTGPGHVPASSPHAEGIVGPRPRFELRAGWLTLLPTEGWTQSLPVRWFTDQPPREEDSAARLAANGAAWLEAQKEAHQEAAGRIVPGDFDSFTKETDKAMAAALRRRGLTRDLASFGVFVGEALENALRVGDRLRFADAGNLNFGYRVMRNSEMVLGAGSVGIVDDGGPMAVWQEFDRHPNPHAEAVRKNSPHLPIAEWIDVHKPYVSVRIQDRKFCLLDGQEARIDPYYVFLARACKKSFDGDRSARAVYAAGRLDVLGKELIIDAARQLTAPRTNVL